MSCGLTGVWKTTGRHENFDDFLKSMGVGMVKRTMAKSASVTVEIKQDEHDDNKFIITTTNPTSSRKTEVEIDQETEVSLPNDKTAKVIPKWEGDCLVLNGNLDGKKVKITRELAGAELLQTTEFDGVVFKRYFKRK